MTWNDLFGSKGRDDCIPCDDGMESEAGATNCRISSDSKSDDRETLSGSGPQTVEEITVTVTVIVFLPIFLVIFYYKYNGKNKTITRPVEEDYAESDLESQSDYSPISKPLAHSEVVSRAAVHLEFDQVPPSAPWRRSFVAGGRRRKDENISGSESVRQAVILSALPASPQDDDADSHITWASMEPVYRDNGSLEVFHGGFSRVCRAKWTRRKEHIEDVAVKIFYPGDQEFDKLMSQQLKESLVAREARDEGFNRHVVKLYGIASGKITDQWRDAFGRDVRDLVAINYKGEEEMLALVMRYETSGTLHQKLHDPMKKWNAKLVERIKLLGEIADGLTYLHHYDDGKHIVHGDIKPHNILLSKLTTDTEEYSCRISDFGLSDIKQHKTNQNLETRTRGSAVTNKTRDGAGTCGYMAPEQFRRRGIRAEKASRSSDVYAFGVLMWEVITNTIPWYDYDEEEYWRDHDIIHAVCHGLSNCEGGLDMSKLPSGIPTLRNLIVSCTSAKKKDRPRIDDVSRCLQQTLNEIVDGKFDVYISCSWGERDCRKPLATEIYRRLVDKKYRVWMDR